MTLDCCHSIEGCLQKIKVFCDQPLTEQNVLLEKERRHEVFFFFFNYIVATRQAILSTLLREPRASFNMTGEEAINSQNCV